MLRERQVEEFTWCYFGNYSENLFFAKEALLLGETSFLIFLSSNFPSLLALVKVYFIENFPGDKHFLLFKQT